VSRKLSWLRSFSGFPSTRPSHLVTLLVILSHSLFSLVLHQLHPDLPHNGNPSHPPMCDSRPPDRNIPCISRCSSDRHSYHHIIISLSGEHLKKKNKVCSLGSAGRFHQISLKSSCTLFSHIAVRSQNAGSLSSVSM
jgi:hypothetical protein